ncbi:MAG: cysteine peptidase family C39 domain-containing protein, partial [Nanoarchaeota archaeon]
MKLKSFFSNPYLHHDDIISWFDISIVKRVVSSITLTCFIILILWTNGLAQVAERIEEQKYKQQPSVYHKWATVNEQVQQKKLVEVVDPQTNQVYRFDKQGKLVEIEDKNNGLIKKFEYDSEGNATVTIVKKQEAEKQKTETETQKPSQESESQKEKTPQLSTLNSQLPTVSSWLTEYVTSDQQKQQEMLSAVGITQEEVKNLSEETKQKIAEYIALHGSKLPDGEVTVKDLAKRTEGIAGLVDKARTAVVMFFVNIVQQVTGEKTQKENVEVQISIEDIQKVAKASGVELNANKTDIEGLKQILNNNPAIAHLQSADGSGTFLIVTDLKDGNVIGIGSDGKTRVLLPLSEFHAKWTGKVLSLATVGEAL